MASVQETVDAARAAEERGDFAGFDSGEQSVNVRSVGPPEDLAYGLTIEELGTLLAMRAQRAWFQGIETGRAEQRRSERERRVGVLDDLAQRLTLEHLAASAPLADALQKARKAFEAGSGKKSVVERTKAREALGKALTECADAYAKCTAEMSA